MLGDYETVNTSALPKIDDIERDLTENGFSRLISGGEKSERLKAIDAELRASICVLGAEGSTAYAQISSRRL